MRPPEEVLHHKSGKVQIEWHKINSMNKRSWILSQTTMPTLGILSLVDDMLRPRWALYVASIRWPQHHLRILGFDAWSYHIVRRWKISRMNQNGPMARVSMVCMWMCFMICNSNIYSITLPSKAWFLHCDYLDLYTMVLPQKQILMWQRNNLNYRQL